MGNLTTWNISKGRPQKLPSKPIVPPFHLIPLPSGQDSWPSSITVQFQRLGRMRIRSVSGLICLLRGSPLRSLLSEKDWDLATDILSDCRPEPSLKRGIEINPGRSWHSTAEHYPLRLFLPASGSMLSVCLLPQAPLRFSQALAASRSHSTLEGPSISYIRIRTVDAFPFSESGPFSAGTILNLKTHHSAL